jgi:hypothetical protein
MRAKRIALEELPDAVDGTSDSATQTDTDLASDTSDPTSESSHQSDTQAVEPEYESRMVLW